MKNVLTNTYQGLRSVFDVNETLLHWLAPHINAQVYTYTDKTTPVHIQKYI